MGTRSSEKPRSAAIQGGASASSARATPARRASPCCRARAWPKPASLAPITVSTKATTTPVTAKTLTVFTSASVSATTPLRSTVADAMTVVAAKLVTIGLRTRAATKATIGIAASATGKPATNSRRCVAPPSPAYCG